MEKDMIPIKDLNQDKVFKEMAYSLGKYIESLGGTAVVIGGTSSGKEVNSPKNKYFIKIGIVGKRPTKIVRT